MPLNDFDTQIQCEEHYPEPEPDVIFDDDDEDISTWHHDLDPWGEEDDQWVRSDGTTGPAGQALLESLTPEDFV